MGLLRPAISIDREPLGGSLGAQFGNMRSWRCAFFCSVWLPFFWSQKKMKVWSYVSHLKTPNGSTKSAFSVDRYTSHESFSRHI